jgi:hypothetical protein
MSTFIRFPKTNPIPFIRVEEYVLLQTDTTRLMYDLQYESITTSCYFTKFRISDGLWLQYKTNSLNAQAFMVAENGTETEITSSIVALTSPGDLTEGRKQYELELNLSPFLGRYYIRFEFNHDPNRNQAIYQSEWFDVQASFDNSLQIGCSNNSDLQTYNDGIIWNDRVPYIWIHSRLSDIKPAVIKSVITTSTGKELTTSSTPKKIKKWQVEWVPAYMVEILNIWLSKHFFYINGEWYNTSDTFETERLGDTTKYPFELNLTLVEDVQGNGYEDYTEDQPIDGTPPVVADILRTTGLTTRTTGLTDRKINN